MWCLALLTKFITVLIRYIFMSWTREANNGNHVWFSAKSSTTCTISPNIKNGYAGRHARTRERTHARTHTQKSNWLPPFSETGKYSKTCVKRPLKNRQNKDLNDKCSLMKVKSIAEAWSILQYFWPALSGNWTWKPIFGLFERSRFTQVLSLPSFLLYCTKRTTSQSPH